MRKRNIITNFIVVLFSLLLLVISSDVALSQIIRKNADNELLNYLNITTQVYDGTNMDETIEIITNGNEHMRVTFIDKDDFSVIKDAGYTVDDSLIYESHEDRPEIIHLGKVYRRTSATLKKTLFYVAALDDGVYIRVSMSVVNVDSLKTTYDIISSVVVVLIMIISTVAFIITSKGALRPVNEQVRKLGEIVEDDSIYNDDDIKGLSHRVEKVRLLINKKINEINSEREKVNYIINNIDHGLIILDGSSKVMLINQIATSLFDVLQNDVEGKDAIYLFRNEEIMKFSNEVLETNKSISTQIDIKEKTYLVNFNPIKNDWSVSDSRFGVAILLIDITKLSQVETMKKDFFANASHELKSPLTTVIGYLQMLDQEMFDSADKEKEAIKESIKEAKRMGKVITDMLELSYLEGDTRSETESVAIHNVINELVSSQRQHLEEKNIEVTTDLEEFFFVMNPSDTQYLISNLLDNAIKYNKQNGSIAITLKNRTLVISDTGIGISKIDLERVFERFYRVSKSRSRELGGTGLGLSIVKHICNNYDLSLTIDSELDKGTTITVIFK